VAQLKADEVFFEATKVSCRDVAFVWAGRSRRRTEELHGVITAIKVLSNDEAKEIFKRSSTTFVQLQASHHSMQNGSFRHAQTKQQVFAQLSKLASKYGISTLGGVALTAQSGSAIRKVIIMIVNMIGHIRKEEARDIAHRDRCENARQRNSNVMEDVKALQEQAKTRISRLTDERGDLKSRLESLEGEIEETQKNIKDRLDLRNKEQADFENTLKSDKEAIDVLNQAIVALTAFYKKHGIPMTLVQQKPPEYSIDPDKAPELAWEGKGDAYTGHKEENHGIVQILSMLVEDYTHEMKTGRADNTKEQELYEGELQSMTNMLHSQKESYVGAAQELAEMEEMLHEAKGAFDQKGSELSDQAKLKKELSADCSWIKKTFRERREKRKAELDGLAEAKNVLAAAQGGSFDELMLVER